MTTITLGEGGFSGVDRKRGWGVGGNEVYILARNGGANVIDHNVFFQRTNEFNINYQLKIYQGTITQKY